MRDDDHGHPLASQVAHDAQHVAHELGVECTRRLVEKHDVRVHGQGARYGDALLLTAGKLRRHKIHAVGKADLPQFLDRDALGLLTAALEHLLLRDHHVLFRREVREQVELLKHHAQGRADLVDVHTLPGNVYTLDHDRARGGRLEQVDAPQHRRLAGTRRPQHHDDLAAMHVQVDSTQDLVAAVRLVQSSNLHHGGIASTGHHRRH